MPLTAPPPDRRRAIEAREHAAAFLDSREDALIEEVWTTGTLRDRIEMYRFLKPYAHGAAKSPSDAKAVGETFEEVMALVAAEKRKAQALETTVETVSVVQVPSEA